MTKLRLLITTALFAAALFAALGGTAVAGYKQASTVFITGTFALGALGDVRASADTNEYIGCSVTGTTGASAVCSARDTAGNYVACSTTNPSMVQAASNVGSASYMYFNAGPTGQCTGIAVYNYSYATPMVP